MSRYEWRHYILTHEDDANLIGINIGIKGNVDVLLNAYKNIGLAVNTEKTKYMEDVIEV
jgi:hypothetical protein